MQQGPKPFQYRLAIIGSFLLLASFPCAALLKSHNFSYLGQLFTGYGLGFIFAFSIGIVLEIFRGNLVKIAGTNKILRVVSYTSMMVLMVLSIVAFVTTNYVNISSGYNTTVFIGSVVCGFGLLPVLQHHSFGNS